MEGALDAQSLISLSLRKIHSSRSQRGGIKLHKNLLVSYVLRNARQLYLSQRYAELCRRQQQQHPQLHYQPFPGAPTAGNDFHIPDDEGDASDDYPPPHPHHQLRSCSLLGRSSEAMEDLPAPSGMRGEALAPFYPHRPLPPGSPLPPPPPPYDFSSLHAQPPPLPSGHGSPTPAFPPPPPPLPPPCPSRTTVLDLDTHVVTTVDNGYLHQDCGCAQCPPVGAGTHPAAPPPLPPPSPLSLLQTKRRYVQDVSIPPNGPERGAVEVVLGAPFPFKRKYDDPDSSTGDPPRDHITPPTRDPCPKRARLEDFSESQSSSSNISNLISIFGSGFTGLVGRQQQQQQLLLQQQPPSPSAQQVWHQQVPQASSCSTATAAAAQPIDPEQQQQQQQHLNGQLCSKQALASLGAWTRAIVAF